MYLYSPRSETDQSLIDRLNRGDYSALGPLVEQALPYAERALYGHVPPDVVDDIRQETALRLLEALPRKESNVWTVAGFHAYVMQTVRHHVIIYYRKAGVRRRYCTAVLNENGHSLPNPYSELRRKEREDALCHAFHQLPEREQRMLRYLIDGLSREEIAAREGESTKIIRNRIWRARRKIQRKLANW